MSTVTNSPSPLHPLTCLIVDEERMARWELLQLCRRSDDIRVVGEATSGGEAIEAAVSLSPDLMLVDASLPDMSGFEVLRGGGRTPLGIITSHRSDQAARAIREGAIDFLMKPIDAERFDAAIGRVRRRYALERAARAQWAPAFIEPIRRPKLLVGERQRRLYPLEVEKIDYIQADGNYVTIRAGSLEYISRDTIKRLAVDLAAHGFVRIDRSILLNIRAVEFAEPVGHGTLAFTLTSGACLHSSKTYREEILTILPWHHCRAGADP